jgi:hypothetical protein
MKKKQRIQLQQEARKTKNQVATSKKLQKKNRFRQEVFACLWVSEAPPGLQCRARTSGDRTSRACTSLMSWCRAWRGPWAPPKGDPGQGPSWPRVYPRRMEVGGDPMPNRRPQCRATVPMPRAIARD